MKNLNQSVEKFRSWSGKNYNGVIYVNNEKITDSTPYLWAQKMKEGFLSILESRPFLILNNQEVNNKLLVASDYIIVQSIISGSYIPQSESSDVVGMGKELAKIAALRIEYMTNRNININSIIIDELVKETVQAVAINAY